VKINRPLCTVRYLDMATTSHIAIASCLNQIYAHLEMLQVSIFLNSIQWGIYFEFKEIEHACRNRNSTEFILLASLEVRQVLLPIFQT